MTITVPDSGSYTMKIGFLLNVPTVSRGEIPLTNSQITTVTFMNKDTVIINGQTYTIYDVYGAMGQTLAAIRVGTDWIILADPSVDIDKLTYAKTSWPVVGDLLGDRWIIGNTNIGYTRFSRNGGDWTVKCFAKGTCISCPSGDIAIEDLRPGDLVNCYDRNNQLVIMSVKWIGSTQVDRSHMQDDNSLCLITIEKGAFSENVPFKNLSVTEEHCLYVRGAMIPARMLVNGRSIRYAREIINYEYFHIEFEHHVNILSDGLLSESYLRTGEEKFHKEHGTVSEVLKTWEDDAVAPIVTDVSFVKPVYDDLLCRAEEEGKTLAPGRSENDVGLCLIDQNGRKVFPRRSNGNKYIFHLQHHAENAFLRTACAKPSDVIGPFIDDRRTLGALVGEITIFCSNAITKYTRHLDRETLMGWHEIEQSECRWTNGNALLPNLIPDHIEECILAVEIKESVETLRQAYRL